MHIEVHLGGDWRGLGRWNDFPCIEMWWMKSNLLFRSKNDGKQNNKSNKVHIKMVRKNEEGN